MELNMMLKHLRPLHRLRPTPWVSLAMTLAALYACKPSTQLENLRHGVPAHVVPGSYKLTVAPEANEASSFKVLSEHAQALAQEQGCGFGGLEALSWEPGVISVDLASTYQLKLTNCE